MFSKRKVIWKSHLKIEEDISQEYRLKIIKQINNYFIKEIDQNELLSNKYKKVYTTLKYIEQLDNWSSWTIRELVTVFASLINISIGIISSTIGLNIFSIVSKFKKYKSIAMKKRKRSTVK